MIFSLSSGGATTSISTSHSYGSKGRPTTSRYNTAALSASLSFQRHEKSNLLSFPIDFHSSSPLKFSIFLSVKSTSYLVFFKGSELNKIRDLLSESQMERSRALEEPQEMKSKLEEAIMKQKIAPENSDADEKCDSESRRRRHEDQC